MAFCSAHDFYLTPADIEPAADQLDQVLVGAAVNRWCGDAQFKSITAQANNLIARCSGLDQAVKQQGFAAPLVVHRRLNARHNTGRQSNRLSAGKNKDAQQVDNEKHKDRR